MPLKKLINLHKELIEKICSDTTSTIIVSVWVFLLFYLGVLMGSVGAEEVLAEHHYKLLKANQMLADSRVQINLQSEMIARHEAALEPAIFYTVTAAAAVVVGVGIGSRILAMLFTGN